jgi:hypothetical protein
LRFLTGTLPSREGRARRWLDLCKLDVCKLYVCKFGTERHFARN